MSGWDLHLSCNKRARWIEVVIGSKVLKVLSQRKLANLKGLAACSARLVNSPNSGPVSLNSPAQTGDHLDQSSLTVNYGEIWIGAVAD